MAVELTVCGLHVVRGDEPFGWQTGLYHEEVVEPGLGADPDFAIAVEFTKQRVRQEGLLGGWDATFFTAAVHPGHIDRCEGFDFADVAIEDLDAEADRYPEELDYTVCGMFLQTGQTYSGIWGAHGPLAAYYGAWDQARAQGITFLLAGVHEGVHASYELPFADSGCRSKEEMRACMNEFGITA